VNEFYLQKAAVPREARNAPDLRIALREYITRRLLHVADVCRTHNEDPFRKEFGLIHNRYANILLMVTEATQNVAYLANSVAVWMEEDFENAATGAQKDAAGLCGAELIKIIEQHT
jgi:hypothetical protein